MKTVAITTKETPAATYNIFIGSGALASLPELISDLSPSNTVVVTDTVVARFCYPKLTEVLGVEVPKFELTPGESDKSVQSLEQIWKFFSKNKLDRKALVLNLGGGIVGDLGGFAAATYMRGIRFIQIPTTLLAQVDASIGGKLAINLAGIKNLVGSFTQPEAVINDIDTLASLPKNELRSGFAEVLKHGFIKDLDYLDQVSSFNLNEASNSQLEDLVVGSCKIKASIVHEDDRESGKRKLLNFGHTLGHAIESISHETADPLLHGEAISIGMHFAAKLSHQRSMLTNEELNKLVELISAAELPVKLKVKFPWARVLEKMLQDKKNTDQVISWTLLNGLANGIFDQKLDLELVKDVYENF